MRPTPFWAILAVLVCLLCENAHAASLEISPLTISLAPGQTATTIEVKNRGAAPAAIQARAYNWGQVGDDDVLTPTQDIILSPPIFTIPENASQTVRLLLRGSAETREERSYRLLLDEVPPANNSNKQLVIALRISLPIIVSSTSAGPSVLQWRLERNTNGQTHLTASNTGRTANRVGTIELTLADGSHPKIVSLSANSYVLPGVQRHWRVQGGTSGKQMHLSVTTQLGRTEQALSP